MHTPHGIAYDRAGPRGAPPVVLVHAGIADRRMWDPIWPHLTKRRDAVRLDLRGYGDSATAPTGALDNVTDVLDTLAELGVERCPLVGASYGSGIAVEVALTRPALVDRLLLCPPGGSLLADLTPDLRAFFDAENAALEAGDLDAAVQANLTTWVAGPHRRLDDVDPTLVGSVATMQRRAFDVTVDWDVEERELDPPALDRLAEIDAPTWVLVGGLDLDTTHDAARRVVEGVTGARRVDWPDVAHLPSMERPADFLSLLGEWLAE